MQKTVRRCICLTGQTCAPAVYVPLLLAQCAAADTDTGVDMAVVARRGLCLLVLSSLMGGASPEGLRPSLPSLAATVAMTDFCVPPVGLDADRASTYATPFITAISSSHCLHTILPTADTRGLRCVSPHSSPLRSSAVGLSAPSHRSASTCTP